MDCRWDGDRFDLHEIHRFPNAGVRFGSDLHWDVLRIWTEIQNGLLKHKSLQNGTPVGIGVDTWGVDYCLLDDRDRMLGNPFHYRDARTSGMPDMLKSVISGYDLFRATGAQTMEINTSFQLASMVAQRDGQLQNAHTLLMIPDLFQFLLSGEKRAEYTEATTTQLYNLRGQCWSQEVVVKFGLPPHIFPEVVMPGKIIGKLLPSVQSDLGLAHDFPCIAVASHDTASAVAAIPELDAGSAFLSSGTWSLMGVAADEPNLSYEAFRGGFTNEGSADGRVLLLKNMTGLWILQECVRIWEAAGKQISWTEMEEAGFKATPFRSFIDPSASEFQSPADMATAIGNYCAQSRQRIPETVGEIARCVFESLSFAYREVAEDLEQLTDRRLTTIRIVGGGCLNRSLCQMTADASGRRVIAGPVEAAALGNAMVQAVATGHISSLSDGQAVLKKSIQSQTYLPVSGQGWQAAFEKYKSAIARVRRPEQVSSQA
jgi:sugar (pentulose or hexulose) kinase